jgi:cytochrome c-type biogenesis protein CcmH
MTLWFVFALMTAAAILVVLWPLGRRRAAVRSGSDAAIYQDQLRELERDRTSGLIGEAEYAAARTEVSRRLLAAVDAPVAPGTAGESMPKLRRRAVALATVAGLPIAALSLYASVGSPLLPDQPLAPRLAAPGENRSIAALVAQVESHLDRHPQDGRGWQVLAPVYLRVGRVDDAVKARRNVVNLLGPSAAREADLGEALVAAANGVVTADAKAAFERALALDPKDAKARFFIGLAAEQDGQREPAAAIWRGLLSEAPPDAPWASFVAESLARVEEQATSVAGGPSSNDMARAAELGPDERAEMVRGMVARLAERLDRDGADLDGWLRLVRAYAVLGERDKALAAAANARRALASDPEKIQRLDALVKGLGLKG